MATVLRFPMVGWCVRPGVACAHYFRRVRGRAVSACGAVERVDAYSLQRLRPLQADKMRCRWCERALSRKIA